MGGLSLPDLARRVRNETVKDDLLGTAAQLSYYFVLALFPMLIFVSAIIGEVFEDKSGLQTRLLAQLRSVMPGSAFALVEAALGEIASGSNGRTLSFGVVGTVWAASSGMQAVINGLNIAYDVQERRRWWRRRLVAIALTLVLTLASIASLALVLFGRRLGEYLAAYFAMGAAFDVLWSMLRFVFMPVFVLSVFTIVYRYAPNIRNHGWLALMPGAVVGTAVWFAATGLFRLYLRHFDTYSKTYGSLGAVIVLMLWLYVTGAALLVGGEVNSEIRKAAADAGASAAQEPIQARSE